MKRSILSHYLSRSDSSTCAILYYLARDRRAQDKLHKELDDQLSAEDLTVATGPQVKNLPYMDACINESLRLHSTSALGLPRVVPEGGLTIDDHYFPPGTVLSVPSFTIHRDKRIWGDDVDDFRPERWFEQNQADIQKTFNPFSIGPRACVGRNLAYLELQLIIASIMRRYDIVLESPDQKLETREGFLRKPLGCKIGIKRRDCLGLRTSRTRTSTTGTVGGDNALLNSSTSIVEHRFIRTSVNTRIIATMALQTLTLSTENEPTVTVTTGYPPPPGMHGMAIRGPLE
ncbi:hypothetical protein NLJ89_g10052 [Agrocybe chaxingu]|uniref:Cytochrome P450 monooxygenase n=1 Tax=Agrocybe chaxingu TaxID=84603 RepID=A0A9W8JUU9_9AGAR|nr:hypothetical protein NLJ89_g10052 [Agrocybe chaxingu]